MANRPNYKLCILILMLVILFMMSMLMMQYHNITVQTDEVQPHKEFVKNIVSEPDVFKFDPMNIKDCSDIYKGQGKEDLILPERYKFVRPLLEAELRKHGGAKTGHVGLKPLQAAFFLDLVNASFIQTVCEIGFNAGHSTMVWLSGNDKCKVYSFDEGIFRYSKPMSKFLQKEFPGRLKVIWGDSKKTVPNFTMKNPEIKCDLIYVDGGHNYREAKADLRNLRTHANPNFHVLMADDYIGDGIKKAWMEELRDGQLEEHFNCKTRKYIKWSLAVGKYINLH